MPTRQWMRDRWIWALGCPCRRPRRRPADEAAGDKLYSQRVKVKVPPTGTRGAFFPRLPHRVARWLSRQNLGMFRRRGGMVVAGTPTLVLETTGAKSGELRHAVLGFFPDDPDAWLIVASMGGASRHPAWLYNLARNQNAVAELGDGSRVEVVAESLEGPALEAAWARIAADAPRYGAYVTKTDREIPVVRLRSRDSGTP